MFPYVCAYLHTFAYACIHIFQLGKVQPLYAPNIGMKQIWHTNINMTKFRG